MKGYKLTVDDVNQRLSTYNLSLVGHYEIIKVAMKVNIKCHCNKIFNIRLNDILHSERPSCGCLRKSKKLSNQEILDRLKIHHIELIGEYINNDTVTKFRCHCDNEFEMKPKILFDARSSGSCGCRNPTKLKNISKQKINRLSILELLPKNGDKRRYLCECECGKIIECDGHSLISENTKSCGCLQKEIARENGYRNLNPNISDEDRQKRNLYLRNQDWSKSIMERDNYTCQVCKLRGGKLNAHHLNGYHWYKRGRLDLENGVTLCTKCHKSFHKQFGQKWNDFLQYLEFKNNHE